MLVRDKWFVIFGEAYGTNLLSLCFVLTLKIEASVSWVLIDRPDDDEEKTARISRDLRDFRRRFIQTGSKKRLLCIKNSSSSFYTSGASSCSMLDLEHPTTSSTSFYVYIETFYSLQKVCEIRARFFSASFSGSKRRRRNERTNVWGNNSARRANEPPNPTTYVKSVFSSACIMRSRYDEFLLSF